MHTIFVKKPPQKKTIVIKIKFQQYNKTHQNEQLRKFYDVSNGKM
jgi:hypothetical protein